MCTGFEPAVIIRCGAFSVPALFCLEETEIGGSVWMAAALDWAVRWGKNRSYHSPVDLNRDKMQVREFPFNTSVTKEVP